MVVPLSGPVCPSLNTLGTGHVLHIAESVYVWGYLQVDRSLLTIPVVVCLDVDHEQVIFFKISQGLLKAPTRLIVASSDRGKRLISLGNHFPNLEVIVGDHGLDDLVIDNEYMGMIAIALVELEAHADEPDVLLAFEGIEDVLEGDIHRVFL